MKTDSLYYKLFKQLPSAFFETIGLPSETATDYRFDSVEVKELSFRIDGVFLPLTPEQPIYFVEVQFQRDAGFYSRFLTEIFMYLDKTELSNDGCGVTIYPRRSLDPVAEAINTRYREILESSRIQRFYLNELGEQASRLPGVGLMCLAVEDESRVSFRARQVLAQARDQGELFYEQVLELVGKTLAKHFPTLSQEELLAMMDIKLSDWKDSRAYQETKAEIRKELLDMVDIKLSDWKDSRAYQETKAEVRKEIELEIKIGMVNRLNACGLSTVKIAGALGLSVAQVEQAIQPTVD